MVFLGKCGHIFAMTLLMLSGSAGAAVGGREISDDDDGDWQDDITDWESSTPDRPELELDTAWLTVKSLADHTVRVYWQHAECFGCELVENAVLEANGNYTELIQTKYGNHLEIRNGTEIVCSSRKRYFKERGDYWLVVNADLRCTLTLANDPPNTYLPILWAFLILMGLALLWIALKHVYRKRLYESCRCRYESQDLPDEAGVSKGMELRASVQSISMSEKSDSASLGTTTSDSPIVQGTSPPQPVARRRLRSLDTFRGLSLVVMIFVNYGGGGYYFFQHAIWDGLLVADLVFPWFIFIMGTSMAFSFRGMKKRKTSTWRILWKIATRSFWLFAIGIFLATKYNNDLTQLRIPGVLQRFAVTYLVVALAHFPFATATDVNKDKCWAPLRDVVDYWAEWLIQGCVLALWLGLTLGLPVPDCPAGYLGPGGLHDGGGYANCSGGAAGYIDRKVLTENHIYLSFTAGRIYQSDVPHDPEGIMGSLTSIFMCFLGLQAGKIVATYKTDKSRIIRWLIWGLITGAIGTAMCEAKQTGGWMPLNKNLWSLSFVLVLSSMAFFMLILLYLIIDVWPVFSGAPCFYPGMNSIVIYACQSIFSGYFPVSWALSDPSQHWQRLFMALWGTGVWVVVAYIMYRKRIFVAL